MRQNTTSHIVHRGEQGRSLDHYKREKLFPHINDQYDFRINNKLLVSKIINPRRDKIIMDSLVAASTKYTLKKQKIEPPKSSCSKRQNHNRQYHLRNNRKSRTEQHPVLPTSPEVTFSHLKKLRTIKADSKEDEQEREENKQNRTIFILNKPQNNQAENRSFRNNFVGRIIKNSSRVHNNFDSSRLQTPSSTFDCDMTVSYHTQSGFIKKNIKGNFILRENRDKIKRWVGQNSNFGSEKIKNQSLAMEQQAFQISEVIY